MGIPQFMLKVTRFWENLTNFADTRITDNLWVINKSHVFLIKKYIWRETGYGRGVQKWGPFRISTIVWSLFLEAAGDPGFIRRKPIGGTCLINPPSEYVGQLCTCVKTTKILRANKSFILIFVHNWSSYIQYYPHGERAFIFLKTMLDYIYDVKYFGLGDIFYLPA